MKPDPAKILADWIQRHGTVCPGFDGQTHLVTAAQLRTIALTAETTERIGVGRVLCSGCDRIRLEALPT